MSQTNLKAAETMITAMRGLGRLEPIDEALVTAVLSLAGAVDSDRGRVDARLWGQYQAALRELRGTGPEVDDDEVAELVAALQSPPEVVDPED